MITGDQRDSAVLGSSATAETPTVPSQERAKLLYFKVMTFPGEAVPSSIADFLRNQARGDDFQSDLSWLEKAAEDGHDIQPHVERLFRSLISILATLDDATRQRIDTILRKDSEFDLACYESLSSAVSKMLSKWAREERPPSISCFHFCGGDAYNALGGQLMYRFCLGELGCVSKFDESEFIPAVEAVKMGLKDVISRQVSVLLDPSFVIPTFQSIPKLLGVPLKGMVRVNRDLGMSVDDVLSLELAASFRQLVKTHLPEMISLGLADPEEDYSRIVGSFE